jgi:glycolate oxidase
VGQESVRDDPATRSAYGVDALGRGALPDLVLFPGTTPEVSAVARLCNQARVPLVVRGAGTGYTGGAVPLRGGAVVSMERFDRIVAIDERSLLAVVQPGVVTGDLQRAVERVGLFYPPDPASLAQSSLGGNVAECAGGPRAFKYGTTKRYVLALEAVLPSGEIIRTGSKAVKNVVGYDLTQLLVGSEGTLAIITEITLRLVPRPRHRAALLASFPAVGAAVESVTALIARGAVPAALELLDRASLHAIEANAGRRVGARGAGAVLVIECDGMHRAAVDEELAQAGEACRESGAIDVEIADTEQAREALWELRRQLSPALRASGLLKVNHDVVVPRGRVGELFDVVRDLEQRHGLSVVSFGHAGDGNIHVNIMVEPSSDDGRRRARLAERELFERVVALEGSITGEHGIGFSKAPYLGVELGAAEIELMKRVKAAFDPNGILNPGKIFPP